LKIKKAYSRTFHKGDRFDYAFDLQALILPDKVTQMMKLSSFVLIIGKTDQKP